MAILVTGGAGYIGSIAVDDLKARGEDVVVVDNLVYGHREAVDADVPFYHGNIGNRDLLNRIFAENDIEACMHFSAYAYVGESVEKPQKYFENNYVQTLSLLDDLVAKGIKKFIFSSTCATFGEPQYLPIDEAHPQSPTNPYGWTKFMVERTLSAYESAYGLNFVALRYFNAAGATATRGEDHFPETHLIPLALYAAGGRIPHVSIFGNDYDTPDGTAIRDYIHVSDLSSAHMSALDHLRANNESEFINLGNGNGYSVNDVIETAGRVTQRPIKTVIAPRRAGDPSRLIANAAKARRVLGWEPRFPTLETIIESAWAWYSANTAGYSGTTR